MNSNLKSKVTSAECLEGFRMSRFHVIVTVESENGPDAWTEEWFSRKQPAIEYAQRLMNRLAESSPEDAPKVIVYDSQGPRGNDARRTTRIGISSVNPYPGGMVPGSGIPKFNPENVAYVEASNTKFCTFCGNGKPCDCGIENA
jgi:hypothetical protein